jgi:hypothetical protein
VGVVWIHCSYLIPHSHAILDWLSPLFRFCVPIFVTFWAYFAEKATTRPDWSYVRSLGRLRSIAIPFFAWSFLYWILARDFHTDLFHQISKHWSGYGWPGQYFFLILAQLIVVFPLLRWIAKWIPPWANAGLLVLAVAFLDFVWHPSAFAEKIGDRPFIYWIPYCLLGIHLARGKISRLRVPWPAAVCAALTMPLETKLLGGHSSGIGPYFLVSVALTTFLAATSAVQGSIPRWTEKSPYSGWISHLSTNSLAIFCINPLVLIVGTRISSSFPPVDFPGAPLLVPLTSTVLATVASLLLATVLRRIGLARIAAN